MESIIGVIGTLLGTVLGWLLNSISNRGKLNIYVSYWSDSFLYSDQYGVITPSKSVEQTTLYSYDLILDIYNSRAEPLIMRDIKIAFKNRKKDIIISIPQDGEARQTEGKKTPIKTAESKTINAKSVSQMHLHDEKWKDKESDLDIWKAKKVFLLYKNNKNKQRRILIKKEDYNRYFENHPQEETENG